MLTIMTLYKKASVHVQSDFLQMQHTFTRYTMKKGKGIFYDNRKNAAVISEYSASDGGRYTTCSFDDAGMLYVGTSKGNIDKYQYDLYNNAYVLKESVSCNELNNIKEIYLVDN